MDKKIIKQELDKCMDSLNKRNIDDSIMICRIVDSVTNSIYERYAIISNLDDIDVIQKYPPRVNNTDYLKASDIIRNTILSVLNDSKVHSSTVINRYTLYIGFDSEIIKSHLIHLDPIYIFGMKFNINWFDSIVIFEYNYKRYYIPGEENCNMIISHYNLNIDDYNNIVNGQTNLRNAIISKTSRYFEIEDSVLFDFDNNVEELLSKNVKYNDIYSKFVIADLENDYSVKMNMTKMHDDDYVFDNLKIQFSNFINLTNSYASTHKFSIDIYLSLDNLLVKLTGNYDCLDIIIYKVISKFKELLQFIIGECSSLSKLYPNSSVRLTLTNRHENFSLGDIRSGNIFSLQCINLYCTCNWKRTIVEDILHYVYNTYGIKEDMTIVDECVKIITNKFSLSNPNCISLKTTGNLNSYIIAIDGFDGVGKTTLIDNLYKKLSNISTFDNSYALKVFRLKFPSSNIDKLKLDTNSSLGNNISSYLTSLEYAIDRSTTMNFNKDKLKEYHIIIIDRYVYSNMIYYLMRNNNSFEGMKEYINYMEDFEFKKMGIPVPDLQIFIKAPLSGIRKNLRNRYTNSYKSGICYTHDSDTHTVEISPCGKYNYEYSDTEKYIMNLDHDPQDEIINYILENTQFIKDKTIVLTNNFK